MRYSLLITGVRDVLKQFFFCTRTIERVFAPTRYTVQTLCTRNYIAAPKVHYRKSTVNSPVSYTHLDVYKRQSIVCVILKYVSVSISALTTKWLTYHLHIGIQEHISSTRIYFRIFIGCYFGYSRKCTVRK